MHPGLSCQTCELCVYVRARACARARARVCVMHVQSCGMNMYTHTFISACACVRVCVCVYMRLTMSVVSVCFHTRTESAIDAVIARKKNTYIPVFGCGLGSNRRAHATQPWLQIATFAYPKARAFTGRCPRCEKV